jgi:hypothetical protein
MLDWGACVAAQRGRGGGHAGEHAARGRQGAVSQGRQAVPRHVKPPALHLHKGLSVARLWGCSIRLRRWLKASHWCILSATDGPLHACQHGRTQFEPPELVGEKAAAILTFASYRIKRRQKKISVDV